MLPPLGTPGTDLPVRRRCPQLDGRAARGRRRGAGRAARHRQDHARAAGPGRPRRPGRVVVAEPRRVAARAAARRMAALLGERVGGRVGYTVRGERRVGPATRVEVVTTGVLVRRLQRDPELAGTGAVLLDECHERHLDTDLALAFTVEVRAALRPDLRLLAMSATAQARPARRGRSAGAPVVERDGRAAPGRGRLVPAAAARSPRRTACGSTRALLDHVAAVVRRALRETTGDVLVFLPGAGEIAAVAGRLRGPRRRSAAARPAAAPPRRTRRCGRGPAPGGAGDRGRREQPDRARRAGRGRRRAGPGAAHRPRPRAGRAGHRARCPGRRRTQRAGRAGREAPGRVYRCWSAADHERLPAHAEPEIATADLTGFALELACWGATRTAPAWRCPTRRRRPRWRSPGEILPRLGAVDADGRITARGRALTAVGAHPRLARALLDGAPLVGARRAAEVVALLADDGSPGRATTWPRRGGAARPAPTGRRRRAGRTRSAGCARAVAGRRRRRRRARRPGRRAGRRAGVPRAAGPARGRRGATYLMAGGTAAELAPGAALTGAALAGGRGRGPAPRRARRPGPARRRRRRGDGPGGRRHAAAPRPEVAWSGRRRGGPRGRAARRDRAARRRRPDADPAAVAAALLEGLRREGLALLRWTPARPRAAGSGWPSAAPALGEPWPDVDDEALLAARCDLSDGPARRRATCSGSTSPRRCAGCCPGQVAGRLDELAPERMRGAERLAGPGRLRRPGRAGAAR